MRDYDGDKDIIVGNFSPKIRMLAIDQASKCGWCTINASGVWDFTTRKDESSGMKRILKISIFRAWESTFIYTK